MTMTRIGQMPGGRRLAAAVAVFAVFSVLGAFAPAVQASAFAVSTWTKQAPASSPLARYGEAMAYDAATGTTVLFGGFGSSGVLGDTWTWDGSTWTWDGSTWTKQAPASHPTARYDTDSTYDAASGSVVLFGGIGNNGVPGDTWTWGPSM